MPSKSPSLTYRRLRAPRKDGELLLEPAWPECLDQPTRNAKLIRNFRGKLFGKSLVELRQAFRQELLQLAKDYTSRYADTDLLPQQSSEQSFTEFPIIMTGHQPRLFHSGVWAKNFITAELASAIGGTPIHVIIDNDVMREHALRVPTGTVDTPRVVVEAYDSSTEPTPFENRYVRDRSVLESFPVRVANRISSFVAAPLILELWPKVLQAIDNGKSIGNAFAEARHITELEWGLRTLEVPLSDLCNTQAFRWFAFWLLSRGRFLAQAHNQRLGEYRSVHKLRSPAQPLPHLVTEKDGWTEAPFWLWTKDNSTRRSLWWCTNGDDLLLSDQSRQTCWTISEALSTPVHGFKVFEQLCEEAFSLRPRALTNTMFLRLFASDVFVHGIGGAKYDQITDLILFDLFRELDDFEPPDFIAVSQTTFLPTGASLVTKEQYAAQKQRVRQMYFHPERFLDERDRRSPKVSCIEENKSKLIAMDLPKGKRADRHRGIQAANEELRGYLQKNRENEEKILGDLKHGLFASEIFASREWSFCLFPEEFLKSRMLDLRPR